MKKFGSYCCATVGSNNGNSGPSVAKNVADMEREEHLTINIREIGWKGVDWIMWLKM
jgi:hypothetical protein